MVLPATKQLRDLLESRLGREVTVRPVSPLPPTAPGVSFTVYVDTHLRTLAVLLLDLPAAAYLGAAAGLVPAGVAKGAVDDQALPDLVTRRLHGLLDSLAALFGPAGDTGSGRARVYSVTLPGQRPPADVLALAAARGRRLDLEVDVRAYGRGRLSLVEAR